jgi:type IV secretory pathway protease TraF
MTAKAGTWLLILSSVGLLGGVARYGVPAVLVYGPSNSMPKGWYVRDFPGRDLRIGDLIVLETPESLRPYMPPTLPQARVLKQVAALAGSTVCWETDAMVIEQGSQHTRYAFHPAIGTRNQPDGCHVLQSDEMVIVGVHERSFDSRYVGPVSRHLVQFRVWPLWTWEAE